MLEGPGAARASATGLDFVKDQQNAMLARHFADVLHCLSGDDVHPQCCRDRLQGHGRGMLVEERLDPVQVFQTDLHEPFGLVVPGVSIFLVAGAHGEAGMPMIAAFQAKDCRLAGIAFGHLEREIHGFAAARREHDPPHAFAGRCLSC